MILKMEKKRQTDEAYIKDLLKSTGYLFPETDEQMSIYEANVTLIELPEKFRTPEFVFNAVQNQRSSKHCTDMDKAILAGHIINTCNMKDFGRVKFQKLLYLVEHVCLLNLRSNYIRQTAGPYDGILLKRVETMLQQYHFYDISQQHTDNKAVQYIPLSSAEELDDLFRKNFPTECDMIDTFLFKFHKATMEQCEIVATLYAVWNNRIIRQQEITDELLKADFLAWDPHKYKYRDRVMKALIWMRKENIIPVGWGDIVE